MFKRLMDWLGGVVSATATKYALRASVVIPFAFAVGFAIAGIAALLIEMFGYRDAYFLMAGGFAVLGVCAVLLVRWHEKHAEAEAEKADATTMASAAATVASQMPAAVMGSTKRADESRWLPVAGALPMYALAIGLVLLTLQSGQHRRDF
jgi:hypothetical protein